MKEVQIIARVEFKCDSRKVCYQVLSSDGVTKYTTCLLAGKAVGCDCPATKPCYHMAQVEQYEALRSARKATEARLEQAYVETVAYSPAHRAGSQWSRFQQRGQDISFATEAEARDYLHGVAGETRIEPVNMREVAPVHSARGQGWSMF
jgi:hypothetical protein